MGTNHYFILLLSCTVSFVSCDESLPVREEPQVFLVASHSFSSAGVDVRDSTVTGAAGAHLVEVKNVYDEVLQDEEFARATVEVWMRDQPQHRTTIVGTKSNLTDQSLVFGGQLTLRPNVTARFLHQWSHKTSDGQWFWRFVRLEPKFTRTGEPYLESDSIRFVAKGRVQLFKNKAPENLPQTEFTLLYRIF